MAELTTQHVCRSCRATYDERKGKCARCGSWNTIVPLSMAADLPMPASALVSSSAPPLLATSSKAWNRVMGGIFVGGKKGALYLFAGAPGSGKSTLSLQIAGTWEHGQAAYVSAEESAEAVAFRAVKFGVPDVEVVSAKPLGRILEVIRGYPPGSLLVVDSLQKIDVTGYTMSSPQAATHAVAALREVAEQSGVTILLVCHVTKEEDLAGPRTVEHDVDAVAFIYHVGATGRLLRCPNKNRFGPSGTSAWMSMTAEGLRDSTPEVLLPPEGLAGRVLSLSPEGLPVEVQAVMIDPRAASLAVGVETERVAMIKAALGIPGKWLVRADGDSLAHDPLADLAIAVAMLSAVGRKPLAARTVAWGQLTLDGRIIGGPGHEDRAQSARDLELRPILSPDHFKTVGDAMIAADLGKEFEDMESDEEEEAPA